MNLTKKETYALEIEGKELDLIIHILSNYLNEKRQYYKTSDWFVEAELLYKDLARLWNTTRTK